MLTVSTAPTDWNNSSSRRSSVLNERLPTNNLRPISTPALQGVRRTAGGCAGRVEGEDRGGLGRLATTVQRGLTFGQYTAPIAATGTPLRAPTGVRKPHASNGLDCQFARPDAIALKHGEDEHPTVADFAGARRLNDGLDRVVGDVVLDDDLELHLREQV